MSAIQATLATPTQPVTIQLDVLCVHVILALLVME